MYVCVCERESCLKSVYSKILVRRININIDLYFTAKIPDNYLVSIPVRTLFCVCECVCVCSVYLYGELKTEMRKEEMF